MAWLSAQKVDLQHLKDFYLCFQKETLFASVPLKLIELPYHLQLLPRPFSNQFSEQWIPKTAAYLTWFKSFAHGHE